MVLTFAVCVRVCVRGAGRFADVSSAFCRSRAAFFAGAARFSHPSHLSCRRTQRELAKSAQTKSQRRQFRAVRHTRPCTSVGVGVRQVCWCLLVFVLDGGEGIGGLVRREREKREQKLVEIKREEQK